MRLCLQKGQIIVEVMSKVEIDADVEVEDEVVDEGSEVADVLSVSKVPHCCRIEFPDAEIFSSVINA